MECEDINELSVHNSSVSINPNVLDSPMSDVTYNSTPVETIIIEKDNNETNNKKKGKKSVLLKLIPQFSNRLYSRILKAKDIEKIVCYWINKYKMNNELALIELIQLFIDIASYQHINLKKFLKNHSLDDVVSHLESSNNPILTSSGKYFLKLQSKSYKYKQNKIGNFIIQLVIKAAKEKIIYDHNMFIKSVRILLLMTNSKYRAIKHTGVFFSLKFQTGLLYTAMKINGKLQVLKESCNVDNNLMAEKAEKYQSKMETLNHFEAVIKRMIKYFQVNVFQNNLNFQDSQLHYMRTSCLLELYNWIDIHPNLYLERRVLENFTAALSDPHYTVRYTALELIGKIIDKYRPTIQSEISKLLIAISQRIKDVNFKIAVLAVDIITALKRYTHIPKAVRNEICNLLFHKNYSLAAACGRYIVDSIKMHNKQNEDKYYLTYVLLFQNKAISNGFGSKYPYLIDALFDSLPVLQKISAYINLIEEGELDANNISMLINILTESVHIMFTGESTKPRPNCKKRIVNPDQVQKICKKIILALRTLTNHTQLETLTPLLSLIKKHVCQ